MTDLVMRKSVYSPRALCAEELAAVEFFEKVHGGARDKIDVLEVYYLETICDAGPQWASCEFTQAKLAGIQNDIDELVGYWVERIRDWASD